MQEQGDIQSNKRRSGGFAPLGRYISGRLEELNQTQTWLGEQVGLSAPSMTRIMYGDFTPRANIMQTMADALGVGVTDLLTAMDGGMNTSKKVIGGRVAYIADQLQQLVDESSEERAAEILDHIGGIIGLLRGGE